ncbi:MAG: SynChlorMet cassette radical SAM/SPASM protein ScmF [Desulfomonile tiedjei]|nr:SynChlorMet cassette radical SAM/SPASM protein ScmF [Desulfomonile tiedjei]
MNPRSQFPLHQLYFYLTSGCNLRCRHCWIAPTFEETEHSTRSLDPDLFRSVIAQAKPLGLSAVKLTGGEPLLHPDIEGILDHIRQEELSLTVETNGTRCTPEVAAKLHACNTPFVSVSLDGSDAETHEWIRGVPGCFDSALEGVKNLVAAGFHPQIIMTVMRRNHHQMESLVRLAESVGAGSVKFNLVQPTSRGERMHERGETLDVSQLVALGRWVERELAPQARVKIFYSHPPAFRPLGRMYGDNGDGAGICGIFGILGVLGDGSYALCGIGESVRELIFGHAESDRLEEVWNHHPILTEIREGLPAKLEGICSRCLMRSQCLGNCIAQNYYRSKHLWAPFWYCEEAEKSGLFPETRAALEKTSGGRELSVCELSG